MSVYYIIREHNSDDNSFHYDEGSAREAMSRLYYTDKNGVKQEGKEHWTPEQIEVATSGMKFPEGTTKWDRYVAFNAMYFDLCRALDDASILKAAHAFYFADEDYTHKQAKIMRYVDCMSE